MTGCCYCTHGAVHVLFSNLFKQLSFIFKNNVMISTILQYPLKKIQIKAMIILTCVFL